MSDGRGWRQPRSRLIGGLVALVLLPLVIGCARPTPSTPAHSTAVTLRSSTPASSPNPLPSPDVWCLSSPLGAPFGGGVIVEAPLPGGDPCPGAAEAIRAAVASFGFPVTKIRLEPGLFPCDLWLTGSGCIGGHVLIEPVAMRSWVTFSGTSRVAAVSAVLITSKDDLNEQFRGWQGPWRATVLAFDVPPANSAIR